MRLSISEALERGVITEKQAASMRAENARKGDRNANGKKPKGKGKVKDIEGAEQAEVVAEFRELFPKSARKLIHIPMGGSRANKFEGWRLKNQGARKGVSDLFLMKARHGFHGLWIEFKADPPNSASVTKEQREWLEEAHEECYAGCVATGVSAAILVLTAYMGDDKQEFIRVINEVDQKALLAQE